MGPSPPEAEAHGGPSPPTWRPNRSFGRQVSRRRCRLPLPAPLPVFLEEDKGPDYDVLAASRIGGRGRVDTSRMERPARDGAVGHRVIAFEHRDLGRLLLGEPVPLVVRTVGEAGGLANTVVVDPVVGDVGLVGEGEPSAEHERKLLDWLERLGEVDHY